MNKKIAALIGLVVILAGGYASYYAYAATFLIPQDLEVFRDELSALEEPLQEDIQTLEKLASEVEGSPSFKIIPESERKKMADELRKEIAPSKSEFEEFKQNVTNNREIASKYDLLLMGDVADDIRAVYSEEIITLMDKMLKIADDTALYMEKGDNKALAKNLRELDDVYREIEKWDVESKPRLERIVSRLEEARLA